MDYSNRKKHEVIRGTRFGLEGTKRYPAGHALFFEGTNYYVLKLWFQPERIYFISRNGDSGDSYTIYGRKNDDRSDQVSFQNPIGYARGMQDKTHLEIVLPDLPKRYYMSLFPTS